MTKRESMTTDSIYRNLPTEFLHDGCHSRAEAICRRLLENGEQGIGKLWILPSNFQFGRLAIENPLYVHWLVGTEFFMPDVPYRDTVRLHGKTMLWRYHVVAAKQNGQTITVYDSTTGTLDAADYLAMLGARCLRDDASIEVSVLAKFKPYGEALSKNDFSTQQLDALIQDMEPSCPQNPKHWGPYWLNKTPAKGFSVDEHFLAVNDWHLKIERLLQAEAARENQEA